MLESICLEENIHILLVSETWLPHNTAFKIRGFKLLVASARGDTHAGHFGGCAIFIRDDFPYPILQAYDIPLTPDCQVLYVQFTSSVLYMIYRSPSQPYENLEKFTTFFESILDPNVVVCGDLNLPTICWDDDHTSGVLQDRILSHSKLLNMDQLVSEPTHSCGNILDVVLSSPQLIEDVKVKPDYQISDHFCIIFGMNLGSPDDITKIIKCPKKTNIDNFISDLQNFDWLNLDFENVEDCANTISKRLYETFDKHVPRITIIPDYKSGLQMATEAQLKVVRKLRKLKSKSLPKAEEKLKSLLDREAENKRKKYLEFLESDKKNIYKVFDKRQFNRRITSVRLEDGSKSTDPVVIAETLNSFYATVLCTSTNVKIDWFDSSGLSNHTDIHEQLVMKTIRSAKMSDSTGPDFVSNRMIKAAASVILIPLTILFRRVLSTGEIPSTWRTAIINPIPKGNSDSSRPKFTRPISCESNLGKLLEKMICEDFVNELEKSNYFYQHQYGFRTGRSCFDCLYALFNQLYQDLEDGYSIVILALDYSKCFDVIDHGALLQACYNAGIKQENGRYLQNYLKNRTQCVRFQDYYSCHVPVLSSAVQGSHVGPPAWLILSNSGHTRLKHTTLFSFADDTSAYFRFKDESKLIEFYLDMSRLYTWTQEIGQRINLAKTVILQFGKLKPLIRLKMGGEEIRVVESTTILGVQINTRTGFDDHRNTVVKNAIRAVNAARITLEGASWKTKKFVYNTYIRPLTVYCCLIWQCKKVLDQLDEVYRNYFSCCQPGMDQNIPLSPSQDVYLQGLRKIRSEFVFNQFGSLACCRSTNTDSTRSAVDGRMFPTRPRNTGFSESPLSHLLSPAWNDICDGASLPSPADLASYVMSERFSSPGQRYREQLKRGNLISAFTKKINYLQGLKLKEEENCV